MVTVWRHFRSAPLPTSGWLSSRLACLISAALLLADPGRYCLAETWTDSRTVGPFNCRADFPLDESEGLFADLNQLQTDLIERLGVRPAGQSIQLYLFRDQRSYRQYLGRYLPHVPYRRALYVNTGDVAMVFAYRSKEFAVDVRHECTHALLHASLPMVPLWLDEGLAEYFEISPAKRAFDNPHISSVRWSTRLGTYTKMEKLERVGDLSRMGGSEYRNAWAWVHFMLHGPTEAHDELVRFLADIQAQTPPGLLSRRLAQRLPDLERRFAQHYRRWRR